MIGESEDHSIRSIPSSFKRSQDARFRTGVVIHKYESVFNSTTKINCRKYQNFLTITLRSNGFSFEYYEVCMAITLDPSPYYYSKSAIVNFNNIFGVICSTRFTPDVLATRIKKENKSVFVREENIAPLLVSPVCVFTTPSISFAFVYWG